MDFMITIISIVNNPQIAREHLLKGLSRQSARHELLLINNKHSTFKSASAANNFASRKATGDYLMFIHQDVFLHSRNWLKQAEDTMSSLSKIGMAGVAGMIKPKFLTQLDVCTRYYMLMKLGALRLWFLKYGRGNVLHGTNKCSWGGSSISEVVDVQTVDELLLIVPTEVFEQTKFDETACNDWHLYGVDFSLSVQAKGYRSYVLPFSTFHRSEGKVNSSYFATMARIMNKHKTDNIINTTSGLFPTNRALANLLWSQSKVHIFEIFKDEVFTRDKMEEAI